MARGFRFEGESAVWRRAAAEVTARVERSPAFRAAMERAVALAAERLGPVCREPDAVAAVAMMRDLGGHTEVARQAVHDACAETPGALENLGSELLPTSVRDLLLQRLGAVRVDAQLAARRAARGAS